MKSVKLIKKLIEKIAFLRPTGITLGILTILFSPISWAVDFEVNTSVRVRKSDAKDKTLMPVGLLKAGAIVKIPDRVIEEVSGIKVNMTNEDVILDWLGRSGHIWNFKKYTGETKQDYFFPVEIVNPGASNLQVGTIAYVPIRYLVNRGGIEMVVAQDSTVIARKKSKQKQWTLSFGSLKNKLSRSLRHIDQARERVIDGKEVNKKFVLAPDCPLTLEDFDKEIQSVSDAQKVPREIIYSLMQIETAGRCGVIRKEGDRSKSVGLFQVNTRTTDVPMCSSEQLSELKMTSSLEKLQHPRLRCLQNPVVNLNVAVQILRAKYSSVNSQKQPSFAQWDLMSPNARDAWRKALAAFNGGQAYLYQAYYDIKDYSKRSNLNLNPDEWETRRIFMLRSMLKPDDDNRAFSKKMRFKRHKTQTYLNLIYVETVAGREVADVHAQNSLISVWLRRLYPVTNPPLERFLAQARNIWDSCWFCEGP